MMLFSTIHDPSDVSDYVIDFADTLDSGELLGIATITVDGDAVALGVTLGIGTHAPVIFGNTVRFWVSVGSTFQNNPAFNGGIFAVFTATISTNSSPPRVLQRICQLNIKQPYETIGLSPITLAEAKVQCRISDTSEDALVATLINAAREYIENTTGIVCGTATKVLLYNAFTDRLPIYRAPVASVTSVSYTAADGTETTLASNQYRMRERHGVVTLQPAYGITWPATEVIDGAVTVTVSAGYASNAATPDAIRTAALMLVAHWYDNREPVVIGSTANTVPFGVDALLTPYQLQVLG